MDDEYWKVMGELNEQADSDYLDAAFTEKLVRLCDNLKYLTNHGAASALFDFLVVLAKKTKFQKLAVNLLRRPFGLVPKEHNEGLIKCSMAFANALPYEHYGQVFSVWRHRFEKELSFLLVSEEYEIIREGLEILAERKILIPSAHKELAQTVEENDSYDFVPESYVQLCFENELWQDPLMASLTQQSSVFADCLVLKALIEFKNGKSDSNLFKLASQAISYCKILQFLEEEHEECAFILKEFQKLATESKGRGSFDL